MTTTDHLTAAGSHGGRRRTWRRMAVAIAVATMLASLIPGGAAAATSASAVPSGPEGLRFYHPPESRIPGDPGSVIWARPLSGEAALPGADNWLVLYRSETPHGEIVPVSGTVAVPHGEPPEGGWPVMTWTHGTTGNADKCAPSRDADDHPAHGYIAQMNQTLAAWVERGYAVTKTDYQGLGAEGGHSYLIGTAEARAAIDMTLAARELAAALSESALSERWVVNGHSQGGQAALFTAELGELRAPRLDFRGAVSLAPPSQTRDMLTAARSTPRTKAGYYPLLIRGAETETDLRTRAMLTAKAWEILPHADDRCAKQLFDPSSWGGIQNNEVFRDGPELARFDRIIDANDPAHLAPDIPVLLVHGGQDQVLPHAMSDMLFAQQTAKGTDIEYRFYPEDDHRSVVATSFPDVAAWVDARMAP